ncbi:proclotting enzyme [Aphelenchoides avenae]|nr:proclotting enzyme [Aphelenchus avenae]
MVGSSTLVALLMTLVASSAAEDYLCGDNKQAKNSRRSGSWNYGTSTNPLEFPMLVQLVHADKARACAGSLITDRHVLTARQCVDGVKLEQISVIYGPRTPYGGNASVKSAKSPSDANVDLAVLELSIAVEISDSTIPVCVGDTVDEKTYPDYEGLHFGPKNNKALGDDYHKDTQFCVGKRNQVFAEGVYTGGPILVRHSSGRLLQVGIALKADAENNYGSATRVTMYQKEIGELTGCFLIGAGLNSTTSSKQNCDDVSTTTSTTTTTTSQPRLVPQPEPVTLEEAEKACFALHGTVAAPTEPGFTEYLKGLPNHGPHWTLYNDPWGNNTREDSYVDCYAIDSSQTDAAGHYKIVTKSCNEKLPVVCSVAGGGRCSSNKELYFNGNCYKA